MAEFTNKNVLLDVDINRIKKGHDVSRNTTSYSGILHLAKKDITLDGFLISVDTKRDFNNRIADSHMITFLLTNGVYYKEVEPEKDNLFVTLVKREGTRTRSETFKLVISNSELGSTGTYLDNNTQEKLDKDGMKKVVAQCINTTYYATRLINTSLTLRSLTIEQALMVSFSDFINNSRNIKINGTALSIDKLNIEKPNNDNFLNNITLNSAVTIFDLPTYLQHEHGVYNGNIGTYISKEYITGDEVNLKDSIYIYPLYNPNLIKNKKRKLRLYAEKGAISNFIDTTFVNNENSLDILCSAENSSKQIFSKHSADNGAGFSMLDANYVTRENNSENDRANMYLNQAYDKKDGVPFSRNMGISSNPFQERSDIMIKTGTTLTITWNFSVPELTYPAMPVEYIYESMENNKPVVKVINGVLQAISSTVDNNRKNCVSNLFIFLEGGVNNEK